MPALGRLLLKLFHLKEPSIVAAGLDFVFAFSALYLFYLLAVGNLPLTPAKLQGRTVVVALFLAFIQSPINWVVPWQRPETLPSALLLALALFCLASARKNGIWPVLLLAATACQAFVRSDVPFVFGISLVLMALGKRSIFEEFGTRSINLFMGACIVLIAGGVQAYLQFVRYPHLSYWPGIDLIQLKNNLHLHNLSNCMLALSPFLLLAGYLIAKRIRIGAVEALVAASSVLYFLLWFTVGVVGEVRIFVPFLMALNVVAARVSASFLTDTPTETPTEKLY